LVVLSLFVLVNSEFVYTSSQALKHYKYHKLSNAVISEKKLSEPGEHQFTLTRPEGERTYFIWIPQSYDGSASFPLHISYHGLGDYCQDFGHSTGLLDLSETHNYLFAYPCGWPSLMGNAWNAGTCCLNPSTIDDVGFTRDMVDQISQNYKVQLDRVFVSGFSNGAMMAEILGCEAADLIKASASVAGVVELNPGNDEGLAKCTSDYATFNKYVSTVNIHGNLDLLVPWTGDAILGFPDIPTNFAQWGFRNGCEGKPIQTFQVGSFSNQRYVSCNDSSIVEVVLNNGGGHEWPFGQDFDSSNYIVAFFENVTATVTF